MDSLFLLQFACFIFMFINAFIVALSCLHVRWKNKRYERSRWMQQPSQVWRYNM